MFGMRRRGRVQQAADLILGGEARPAELQFVQAFADGIHDVDFNALAQHRRVADQAAQLDAQRMGQRVGDLFTAFCPSPVRRARPSVKRVSAMRKSIA